VRCERGVILPSTQAKRRTLRGERKKIGVKEKKRPSAKPCKHWAFPNLGKIVFEIPKIGKTSQRLSPNLQPLNN
jgi:hypothetical protein